MAAESNVATELVPSKGMAGSHYKSRINKPVAVVIHTTGSGPVQRWRSEKGSGHEKASAFETAVHRVYGAIMKAGPHYVVGQKGECIQVCREDLVAWHVGSEAGDRYRLEDWSSALYEWWEARWENLDSPTQLAGGKIWSGGSCNANTIGIEVVPPVDDVRGPWSDACWKTLGSLVRDVTSRQGIPLDLHHVVTHSDVHPIARTTPAGKPWDPGPHQWSPLIALETLKTAT